MKTFRLALDDTNREFAEFSSERIPGTHQDRYYVTTHRVHIDDEGVGIWTIPERFEQARLIYLAGWKASRAEVWKRSYEWARQNYFHA